MKSYDEAIEAVREAENALARALMVRAIRRLSTTGRDFTSDAVWDLVEGTGTKAIFRDRRSLGSLMRSARRDRLIEQTGEFTRSTRRHGAPLIVWRGVSE